MKAKSHARAAALGAALVLAAPFGGASWQAQQPIPQAPQDRPIRVDVPLVNIFTTVRDKDRRIVTGLAREDFEIYEDGVRQTVDFFKAESDQMVTLGILLDTSGSMREIFGAAQDAASHFLHRVLRKQDLAMVFSFDMSVDMLADFTADTDKLERAIRRARVNEAYARVTGPTVPYSSGGTNLYDAIYLGCKEKLARETGRKALILITDAEDTGSKVSLKEALETAQKTNAVLHVLLITSRGGFGFGGANAGVGKKLAEETGGRMIEVSSEKDLLKAFDQLSEELRTQYTLGFYSTNAARDGGFRKLKVETRNRNLRVLARKGYYAPRG
jgi:VWFA-related protein